MKRLDPDIKFAGLVIRTAVMEKDGVSVEAVILYGKWALTHEPTKFHVVHQMGLKLFEGPELDEFLVKWARLLQGAVSETEEEKECFEATDFESKVIEDASPVKHEKECSCESEIQQSAEKKKMRKRKTQQRNPNEGGKLLKAN
ncbi:hypothetical protein TELCIR_00355 [Teladorsagia circumcincta]|uniref:Uncharacterized protein n=1 Tax=Teladorsagia circumcincta TaxID=45464 RepID=A0A2G9V736_TELCI|nr:hypothetical protein TELCIR_00355 [Teladorsagia circumcincta]